MMLDMGWLERVISERSAVIERKNRLHAVFGKFVAEFRERLEAWIVKLQESGFGDSGNLEIVQNNDERLEVKAVLSGFRLLIIATNEVLYLQGDADRLATKIFVFPADGADETPLEEIIVREDDTDEKYTYGRVMLSKGGLQEGTQIIVENGSGANAADDLIRHLFKFKEFWAGEPTRRSIQESGGKGSYREGFYT